jgi:hypothetical protein
VKILGAVLVAESVTRDHHRLVPVRHDARDVAADNRLAEDRAVEDVADRAVWRPPHLPQVELLDARFVGRNRGALHRDAVFPGGFRGIDGDPVVGLVPRLDPEVVVLQVDVEVRQDQRLADLAPDDSRHFVPVHLDDGILHLDLCHASVL